MDDLLEKFAANRENNERLSDFVIRQGIISAVVNPVSISKPIRMTIV